MKTFYITVVTVNVLCVDSIHLFYTTMLFCVKSSPTYAVTWLVAITFAIYAAILNAYVQITAYLKVSGELQRHRNDFGCKFTALHK